LSRAVAAITAGVMDDDEESVFTWIPVAVDDQGRSETTKVMLAAQAEVERISDDSLHRLGKAKRQALQLVVGFASFQAIAAPPEGKA
jgi:hypothetical protein